MHKGNYEMQFWTSNQRYATLNLPVHILINKESFRKLLQSNFGLVIDLFPSKEIYILEEAGKCMKFPTKTSLKFMRLYALT